MGRHSFVAPREAKNPSAVRGIALAGVVGVLAGAGIPAATAAPQNTEADAAPELGAASVSFANAEVAVPEVVENTVSLGGVSEGEWTIESVSVDVEAAPEEVAVEVEEAAPAEAAPVATVEPAPAVEVQVAPEPAPAVEVEAAVAPAAAPAPAGPSVYGGSITGTALAYQGAPYVYGGSSPAGWDCSGFVWWVFQQNGISIPRASYAMAGAGRQVPYSQAQPGDILVWPGHVAISLGNGQNIGALNPGMGTVVNPDYWTPGTPIVVRVGG